MKPNWNDSFGLKKKKSLNNKKLLLFENHLNFHKFIFASEKISKDKSIDQKVNRIMSKKQAKCYNLTMAVRKIITTNNKNLKIKSKPVNLKSGIDKKTQNVIKDLLDTVKAASDPEGIGLSAIQINYPVRIFIAKIKDQFEVFINPVIKSFSKKRLSQVLPKKKLFFEGCLSVPKIYGFVDRPYQIVIEWQTPEGKTKKAKFCHREAICLQHEFDHLDGILFVQRVLEQDGKLFQLKKQDDKEEFEEIELY